MADPSMQPHDFWKPRFEEARQAHRRGWALIAVDGKAPLHKGWQRGERAPLDKVLKWTMKGHNLGLRTGQASGVVVVDDDSPDGSASAALNLPQTVTVITGSGKRHLYFKAPDFKVGNSVKTIAPGIDVRGDGGQVVFVGSIHPDTQQPYAWAPGLSPDEVELAELPTHLQEQLRPRAKGRAKLKLVMEDVEALSDGKKSRLSRYVRTAFESEIDRVRSSVEGERNNVLNKAAFAIGQLVGTGELGREEAKAALHAAGSAIGLPDSEVDATVASGMAAGEREPRDLNHVGASDDTEDQDSPLLEEDERPKIKVHGGYLHRVTNQAEGILLRQQPPIFYQRGTTLVRVVSVSEMAMGLTIGRKPLIQELTIAAIIDKLTEIISWLKFSKQEQCYVKIDCPERVATTLASRAGASRLPPLTGVIDSPTLRSDGGILAAAGYDRTSGLYLASGVERFPPVPMNPARTDALAALAKLLDLLRGFPFVSDADRSVALAAILTALIRPSLRTAPLFAFLASKMGSGKSLLADVVSLIATGRHAAVMSQGADENEDKKRFLPILAEAEPVAVIDNIERPFASAPLCSILTQTIWRDRVLGKSQTLVLPTTNTTWIATGNNVQFKGDITTRTIACQLDAKCERPEEREFDRSLHQYIPDHRYELAIAGLTVLRAYHVAGRPSMKLPVFGRFEEWSEWPRSALVWLDQADPCITRKHVEDSDPVRAELTQLLAALEAHFKATMFRVSDVLDLEDHELRDALNSILSTGTKGQSEAQRLGIYFQKIERRPEGGRRLVRGATRGGTATWRVERV